MEIKVLASSSAGCCYHVTDGRTSLLLEAGIRFESIRKGVGFTVTSISGCLVSHEHGDHSKAVRDVMKAGVDVYSGTGTFRALGLEGEYRAKPVTALRQFQVGTWTILPFEAIHDAEEPLGFLLVSGDEKLLYLTDTAYCRYRFCGLTHLMIECNYSLELLRKNVREGRFPVVHKNRVLRNHMGIERVLDMLQANDLSRVREIHLLHLSDDNSDEVAFRRAVEQATGKPVYIAAKG